jgi:ribosome-binding factor A
MYSSIKQQQVASLMQQTLAEIFIREGRNIYGNAFVTITHVRLTPDLLLSRVYLSVYNVANKQEIADIISENKSHIRHLLGDRLRNKVRRIPEIEFYLDDTLDEVSKIDALFEKLNLGEHKPNEE